VASASDPIRCIVLAAGASTRLGQPKALVPVKSTSGGQDDEGIPLITHLVERLEARGLEVVVVTRAEIVVDILTALPERTVVINPNPDAGRTGTLQCGLRQILDTKGGERAFRLLVVPVDRPGFSDTTLAKLLGAQECCCPAKDGRGGHPLLLMPEDVGRVRAAQPDTPLRDLCSPLRFEVGDSHLHFNLDTPENLQLLNSDMWTD